MAAFGHGVTLENKEPLTGCIHKMLEHLVTATRRINFIQRRSHTLRKMESKSNRFQQVCITVLPSILRVNCTPGEEVSTVS